MSKIVYELRYEYYQYNTGLGDNGVRRDSKSFDSLEEARKEYNRINKSIDAYDRVTSGPNEFYTDEEEEELLELTRNYCFEGYFLGVELFEVTKTEKKLDLIGF